MKPSHLERRLLRYADVPDLDVAIAERLPLEIVTAVRARLRRGVKHAPALPRRGELAELMRKNWPVRGL